MQMLKQDKWKTLSSEYLFNRPWLTVRRDSYELPDGRIVPEYYILEYPDWVNTLAITKDGKFVFVSQYRPGLKRNDYELCAGVSEKSDKNMERQPAANCWKKRFRRRPLARIYGHFSQSVNYGQSDALFSGRRC